MAPISPKLYVVGSPIGNLADISFRAVEVLKNVSLIAAEDTRTTKKLLRRHEINTPLWPYHEQGKGSSINRLVNQLRTKAIALITSAGMPTISDPGYALIQVVHAKGLPIETVPGPSAVTTALSVSGLPPDQFIFVGFLPRKSGDRRRLLQSLNLEKRTLIAFESPHRLPASLKDILLILGNRSIAICRELTKLHEEVFRGTIAEAINHFKLARGEFTLVINGSEVLAREDSDITIESLLPKLKQHGLTTKSAVGLASDLTGLKRKTVYNKWLKL